MPVRIGRRVASAIPAPAVLVCRSKLSAAVGGARYDELIDVLSTALACLLRKGGIGEGADSCVASKEGEMQGMNDQEPNDDCCLTAECE